MMPAMKQHHHDHHLFILEPAEKEGHQCKVEGCKRKPKYLDTFIKDATDEAWEEKCKEMGIP